MSVPKWAIKRSLILKYCTECTDFVPATVVVGGFFGDEGKGKIISHLASIDSPRIVVRGGAGPNAGHTIKHGGKTFKVRMLPSGFLNESSEIMIGPGVVVDPNVLLGEIAEMQTGGRTYVDANCGIIEESHKVEDGAGRLKEKIGSTGSGTGPANAARAMRTLQLAKECDQIKKYVTDVPARIDESLRKGQNVLVEGTQGTFLSLWHGTYPYVTSKDVTASGICADVGIGPTRVDEVMVVFKSYVTRVGTGPMDGELDAKEIEKRQWLSSMMPQLASTYVLPPVCNSAISPSSTLGSTTTPGPIMISEDSFRKPLGSIRTLNVLPPCFIVCPALGPAPPRTTIRGESIDARWDMILPFPSSPKNPPTTTVAGTKSVHSVQYFKIRERLIAHLGTLMHVRRKLCWKHNHKPSKYARFSKNAHIKKTHNSNLN